MIAAGFIPRRMSKNAIVGFIPREISKKGIVGIYPAENEQDAGVFSTTDSQMTQIEKSGLENNFILMYLRNLRICGNLAAGDQFKNSRRV
jgi:hypothetical protein